MNPFTVQSVEFVEFYISGKANFAVLLLSCKNFYCATFERTPAGIAIQCKTFIRLYGLNYSGTICVSEITNLPNLYQVQSLEMTSTGTCCRVA